MPIAKDVNGVIQTTAPVNKRQADLTGVFPAADWAVSHPPNVLKQVKFLINPTTSAPGVLTVQCDIAGDATINLTGLTNSNSFTTIQPPIGTSPTASSSTDTLTFTSSNSTVTITGNSATKTVDFKAAAAGITALTGDVTASGAGSVVATLASVVAASTSTKITYNAKGLITAGTTLASGDIPNNAANTSGTSSNVTGIVALVNGGTGSAAPTGLTGTGNIVLSAAPTLTGPIVATAANFSGAVTASNISGTNTGDQTITLTGNVTGSGTGSFAATIAANAVTNSKLATMTTATVKANITAGTATPTDVPFVSTNTASSGVFRDASGNFSANNVTANILAIAANSVAVSSGYAIGAQDIYIWVDTSAGAVNITLPTPAIRLLRIIDTKGTFSTNPVTLLQNAGEMINGLAASRVLRGSWNSYIISGNATDWYF